MALGLFGFAGTASADHLFEPGSLTCHDHSDVYHVEWTAVDGAIKYTADIKCGYLADDGGDLEFVLSGQGSASSHDGMEASIPYDEIGLWVSTADGDVFVLANSGDICTAYARGLEVGTGGGNGNGRQRPSKNGTTVHDEASVDCPDYPSPDDGDGGPPCSKHPDRPNCDPLR